MSLFSENRQGIQLVYVKREQPLDLRREMFDLADLKPRKDVMKRKFDPQPKSPHQTRRR